ncbi:excinuclease ABC subunit UvrA [Lacticaseibacillus pabuli]|uniref:UvrABC system protein A n=1 Tax=Lacticaseibacillus pabuli TaxID=3025672 RepID=A0ABY7WVJ0_9LACO|nr:excinuclease ABC subunit UvrA [Lacticaseibacillus sp. KACC 23028]WDF82987.1 excinuclease ABC subunit UvrA [Lacticaseibacillus sp. KACC 23028]
MANKKIPNAIEVRGAHVNNLRGVDVDIPLHELVAVTGRSGSGKSSLAMGVLYAEGMRRYVSALSTYTRRRLGQTGKPDVESIEHIPSAIALRQRPTVPGVRSTVGTSTEALNVIRLSFSRLGSPRCPNGHQVPPTLKIAQAMDLPNKAGSGMGMITCPTCGVQFMAFSAEDFAFNSAGACPDCGGTGFAKTLDESLLIPDQTKTIREGAVASWRLPGRNFMMFVAQQIGIDIDTPFKDLPDDQREMVWNGPRKKYAINIPSKTGKIFHMDNAQFENAHAAVLDSMATTTNERAIERLDRFYRFGVCPTCHGSRFKPELMTQLLAGKTIAEVSDMTLTELGQFVDVIYKQLPADMQELAHAILSELTQILRPLAELGLGYLQLSRVGNSLSTGELQRIQLSRTLRTQTTGVLYVLDEPSIGLHAANVQGLIDVMRGLVDQGNSVIVVDHDPAIIAAADHVLEIGPGAGALGGRLINQGSPAEIEAAPDSLIAPFLNGTADLIARPQKTVAELAKTKHYGVTVTDRFNLHNMRAELPTHAFSVVSGFSGAGKSTYVFDALVPALNASKHKPAPSWTTDLERGGIRRVVAIDASPVGKNVRSTVATYTDIQDKLRALFAAQPLAKERGYSASHFSYNVAAGACPTCGGTGLINLDIQYLPDMQEECPTCHGRRYKPEVLDVKWENRSIADILELSVDDAIEQLQDESGIETTLHTLHDLGLGYLHLGESAPALSGGEAQRLKLTAHIGRKLTGTLFVFDEPSVGLHPLDVQVLLQVFQRLLDQGGTVLAIEHDLDVIVNADFVLDIGPGGGSEGGKIVATGTPVQVAAAKSGHTAPYLREELLHYGIIKA